MKLDLEPWSPLLLCHRVLNHAGGTREAPYMTKARGVCLRAFPSVAERRVQRFKNAGMRASPPPEDRKPDGADNSVRRRDA